MVARTMRPRQSGYAMIALIAIIAAGMLYTIVRSLDRVELEQKRIQDTAIALTMARQALIGFAASVAQPVSCPNSGDCSRPGELPCPDTVNDGSAHCGTGFLGRLPAQALGLPDLRDSDGEKLWYAVSANFINSPRLFPLNSDTPGTLTIVDASGNAIASDVVAIIIAPGAPLQREDKSSIQARSATSTDAVEYLDIAGGTDNAAATPTKFVGGPILAGTGTPSPVIVNDQITYITRAELMAAVEKRVVRDVMNCLDSYGSTFGNYPWPSPVSATDYSGLQGALFGRIPETQPALGESLQQRITSTQAAQDALTALQADVNATVAQKSAAAATLATELTALREIILSVYYANKEIRDAAYNAKYSSYNPGSTYIGYSPYTATYTAKEAADRYVASQTSSREAAAVTSAGIAITQTDTLVSKITAAGIDYFPPVLSGRLSSFSAQSTTYNTRQVSFLSAKVDFDAALADFTASPDATTGNALLTSAINLRSMAGSLRSSANTLRSSSTTSGPIARLSQLYSLSSTPNVEITTALTNAAAAATQARTDMGTLYTLTGTARSQATNARDMIDLYLAGSATSTDVVLSSNLASAAAVAVFTAPAPDGAQRLADVTTTATTLLSVISQSCVNISPTDLQILANRLNLAKVALDKEISANNANALSLAAANLKQLSDSITTSSSIVITARNALSISASNVQSSAEAAASLPSDSAFDNALAAAVIAAADAATLKAAMLSNGDNVGLESIKVLGTALTNAKNTFSTAATVGNATTLSIAAKNLYDLADIIYVEGNNIVLISLESSSPASAYDLASSAKRSAEDTVSNPSSADISAALTAAGQALSRTNTLMGEISSASGSGVMRWGGSCYWLESDSNFWWAKNEWRSMVFYQISGQPVTSSQTLSIDGGTQMVRRVILGAGGALSGQSRPGSTTSRYLEGANTHASRDSNASSPDGNFVTHTTPGIPFNDVLAY